MAKSQDSPRSSALPDFSSILESLGENIRPSSNTMIIAAMNPINPSDDYFHKLWLEAKESLDEDKTLFLPWFEGPPFDVKFW